MGPERRLSIPVECYNPGQRPGQTRVIDVNPRSLRFLRTIDERFVCPVSFRHPTLAVADAKENQCLRAARPLSSAHSEGNAPYNAVVALDIQAARNVAQNVDDQRARGKELGALAGLPMTIKDSFEVVGMATTCGLPPLAKYHAERDADAVERLRAAGAVVFGKTNVPLVSATGRPTILSMG